MINPTMPAHWLAENLESDKPTPIFPPIAIAAAKGSQAVAISSPYFITDSDAFEIRSFFLFFRDVLKVSPWKYKFWNIFG